MPSWRGGWGLEEVTDAEMRHMGDGFGAVIVSEFRSGLTKSYDLYETYRHRQSRKGERSPNANFGKCKDEIR